VEEEVPHYVNLGRGVQVARRGGREGRREDSNNTCTHDRTVWMRVVKTDSIFFAKSPERSRFV
jgi:hypothetical protein